MTSAALDAVFRAAGGRIIAALAARFRDLDLAEDSFADACARAAATWHTPPENAAGWLFRVAERAALDTIRRRSVRAAADLPDPEPEPTAEELMSADTRLIPDERLRLIFVCCHPAIAADTRAALTLRFVCGLTTAEIARAFLLAESTLAQRLVRAKRKIADAGIPFAVPAPDGWVDRLDTVLSTLEVAYAHAHADGGGTGRHAGYAAEMLGITATLAAMLPREPEVLALAATVRFAEARRPARVTPEGMMMPLSEQDPALWDRTLIGHARPLLARALGLGCSSQRILQALLHAEWCARPSLAEPPPWRAVLTIYDALLALRDDPVTRLNRAVALAEVAGHAAALEEVDALSHRGLDQFLPYHATRAGLLDTLGLRAAARAAYDRALSLEPAPAERCWLEARRDAC